MNAIRRNALSLAVAALFLVSAAAQIASGRAAYNEERALTNRPPVGLSSYFRTGHFIEALFENWESEFLQMGVFVLLSVRLRQRGSTESKPFDEPFASDDDPRPHRLEPGAPWPVRRGGAVLAVYENSLAIAFFGLFALSFSLHAIGGRMASNEELALYGRPPQSLGAFIASSEFWFQSFQNWQSEFLAIFALVVLTIFLRQRGSPQSKAVAAPHSQTGP